ncbi:collagen alpha-3(VI) chain isoform X2 [Nematostella vectensis]|uniref:collagen alpha-3(VI) chain isoform X2 n=1 Tax=Nematostella vectensis TaxID=45351 RepID=UPI0020776CCC|nr:collagen alpha-3(VI) chain isoform X2 [Nematostella vectensis]
MYHVLGLDGRPDDPLRLSRYLAFSCLKKDDRSIGGMDALVVAISLFLGVLLPGLNGQDVRSSGRCPAYQWQMECPQYVWDSCTCDNDCSRGMKCCFTGCGHNCVVPDKHISITTKADIAFLMDSSGSIGVRDYKKEKQFVQGLSDIFDISPGQSRASLIIYSDFPKLIFDLEDGVTNQNITSVLKNLEYLRGRTRIDKALMMAEEVFADARPTVPRIAFILTDGKQTQDYDAIPLDVSSQRLKKMGVKIYVIGVGPYVDISELRLLTEKPGDVFTVASFEELLKLPKDILVRIDRPDLPVPVKLTADVLFLIDSSRGLSQKEFSQEKRLVSNLAMSFHVSPAFTQVGAATYSDSAKLRIPLFNHSGAVSFNADVAGIPFQGGSKNVQSALELALNTLTGGRPVPKIAIMLTKGDNLAIPGSRRPYAILRALQEKGINLFIIAVGDTSDSRGLASFVKSPKHLITGESFETIGHRAPSVVRFMTQQIDTSTPLDPQVDVVFLIDSSRHVGTDDYKREKQLVSSLSSSFHQSRNGPRVGLLIFGDRAYTLLSLDEYTDKTEFNKRLVNTPKLGGARNTVKALQQAGSMFKGSSQGRRTLGILLLSGPTEIGQGSISLTSAVQAIKGLGGEVHTLSIGPNVSDAEVRIISPRDGVLKVPDFTSLQASVQQIGLHFARKFGRRANIAPQETNVVLVLDGSSTAGPENFILQKDFAKSLADIFHIAVFGSLRVGLITYGNTAVENPKLKDYRSQHEFKKVLDGVKYAGTTRRIGNALEVSRDAFTGSQQAKERILIMVVYGGEIKARPQWDKTTRQLRAMGVKILLVVIGQEGNNRALFEIVEAPNDVITVPTISALPQRAQITVNRALGVKGAPLDYKADIVFLIDSSDEITDDDFLQQKRMLQYVANLINVRRGGSRAAVINYGSTPSLVATFDAFQSLPELQRKVDAASPVAGKRRTDEALNAAVELFSKLDPQTPKVLVFVVGGRMSSDARGVSSTARKLRNLGVKTYGIVAGTNVNRSYLRPVVQDEEDLFVFSLFRYIRRGISPFVNRIIRGSYKPRSFIADLVFLLDSASPVTDTEFLAQKDFVKQATQVFNVMPGKSRSGLVTFGSLSREITGLAGYSTREELSLMLDNAPKVGGARRIDLALMAATEVLKTARSNYPRIAVLLVSGPHRPAPGSRTLDEALQPLRVLGTLLFVVSIGASPDRTQLLNVVSSPVNILQVASFDRLKSKVTDFGQLVKQTPDRENITANILFLLDSSSTVTPSDYRQLKAFVATIAGYLNVNSGGSRAALAVFSDNATKISSFTRFTTLSNFRNAVNNAQYLVGRRRTDVALATATEYFKDAEKDIPRVMVMVATGPPSPVSDRVPIREAARPLALEGVTTFIVAVGTEPLKWGLKDAVVQGGDILPVTSIPELSIEARSIARIIAQRTGRNPVKGLDADIIFLMDSSSGVSQNDFQLEKSFVKNVASAFDVSPGRSRAAVISYGDRPFAVAGLDSYRSVHELERLVANARFVGGTRRMDFALDAGQSILSQARPGHPRIVLLLTSGRQSPDAVPNALYNAARRLRDDELTSLFVVAIGNEPNKQELGRIVLTPDQVINVPEFDGLPSSTQEITKKIAKVSVVRIPLKSEEMEADVIFLMDSSSSVTPDEYRIEKQLVEHFSKVLNVGPDKSRAAVITYGSRPSLVVDLDAYDDLSHLQQILDTAPRAGGYRRMGGALEYGADIAKRARSDVPRIAIMLTAGRQELDPRPETLRRSSLRMRDTGATVFVVSIGNSTRPQELGEIVENPRHVIEVWPGYVPRQRIQEFGKIINQATTPKIHDDFSGDVIILLDSSDTISNDDFKKEKEFVKYVADSLSVKQGKPRIALVTFGSTSLPVMTLNNFTNMDDLRSALQRATAIGGPRRIDTALNTASSIVREGKRDRQSIIVLVTATNQVPYEDTNTIKEASERLRQFGTNLFVIAVGESQNDPSVQAAAGDDTDILNLSSFPVLAQRARYISTNIANRTKSSKPGWVVDANFKADIVFVVDNSFQVNRQEFETEKRFVKSLSSVLNMSPGRSHAAMVTYSSFPVKEFGFQDNLKEDDFRKLVNRAPYQGQFYRRLEMAVGEAERVLRNGRQGVPRLVILLVGKGDVNGVNRFKDAVNTLKSVNAKLFVIKFGAKSNYTALQSGVERKSDLFSIPRVESLQSRLGDIVQHVAARTGDPTPLDVQLEIVFLIDGSATVTLAQFSKEKRIIKMLATALNIGPDKSHGALIAYGSRALTLSSLNDDQTLEEFSRGVDAAVVIGGERRFDTALRSASTAFSSARRGIPKCVIMLTTGAPGRGSQEIADPASYLKRLGVKLFFIALDNQPTDQYLLRAVAKAEDIFRVPEVGGLLQEIVSFSKLVVKRLEENDPEEHVLEADIVFIMDASVRGRDYIREKYFVIELSRLLGIDPAMRRASLVIYGNDANIVAGLDDFKSAGNFERAVYYAKELPGPRRIDKGLSAGNAAFKSSNSGVTKLAVLLTAGRQTEGFYYSRAVKDLRALGVKIFVVAISKDSGLKEDLNPIVERPDDLTQVNEFTDLRSESRRLDKHLRARARDKLQNNVTTDIVFMVDSSTSVDSEDFNKEKDFVKSVSEMLGIDSGISRAAIISYGSDPVSVSKIGGYKSLEEFNRIVGNSQFVDGQRRMDKALRFGATALKTSPAPKKFAVLITSGSDFKEPDSTELHKAAKALHDVGAKIYIVAIGNQANLRELNLAVKDPEQVIVAPSFSSLQSQVLPLVKKLTEKTEPSQPRPVTSDVVFLIDSSSFVNSRDFILQKQFIKLLGGSFGIPGQSQASVISYASSPVIYAPLTRYETVQQFSNDVDNATYLGGDRDIHSALDFALMQLQRPRGDAVNVIVLLIGDARNAKVKPDLLNVIVQQIHYLGAKLYIIGIGSDAISRVLQTAVEKPTDVIVVPDFRTLTSGAKNIGDRILKSLYQPLNVSADVVFVLDSSSSVTPPQYQQMKVLVKLLARALNVNPGQSRAGLITYGRNSRVESRLGDSGTLDMFTRTVGDALYMGGVRRLDRALNTTADVLERARPDKPRILLLFVTGRRTESAADIDALMQPLKKTGAKVFVVAMGTYADDGGYELMVEDREHIFKLPLSENIDLRQVVPMGRYIVSQLDSNHVVPPTKIPTDLIILADSSNGITPGAYQHQQQFAKHLSKLLGISPLQSRAAFVSYGSTQILVGGFRSTQSMFDSAVDSTVAVGGLRRLDSAVNAALKLFREARSSAAKGLVLIVAGPSRLDTRELRVLRDKLTDNGVNLVVVSVGNSVREVRDLVENPENLMAVDLSQKLLPDNRDPFPYKLIIDKIGLKSSDFAADILFLVDNSDFVTNEEFESQLDFIKSIARKMHISPEGTRVGMITYNFNPKLIVDFESYNTAEKLFSRLDELPKGLGSRRLDLAIDLARNVFANSRQNAAKVMVVFAKGRQLTDPSSRSLSEVIKPLVRLDVVTLAVGIGQDANIQQLTSIVQKPEDIVFVQSYPLLLGMVNQIWRKIVGISSVSCNKTLDMGILMDASGSLGPNQFNKERQFIKSIIRELLSTSPQSRVGIIPFSDSASVAISFQEFKTLSASELDTSISNLPYAGGRTRIDLALGVASSSLFGDRRPGVPQILILITDGVQSKDPGYIPVSQAMHPIREAGISSLAVGIGKSIDFAELNQIAADANHVFIVGAFDELQGIVQGLVTRSCSA